MPRRVSLSRQAARDLDHAREWLTQPGSGKRGRALWNALQDSRRELRRLPYLGPSSERYPGLRQLVVSGYRVIYLVDPDTGETATAGNILIATVLGPGQP